MKAFRIILLAGLAVMVANGAVRAQVDSCLIPIPNTSYEYTDSLAWNFDSVMYDTCRGGKYAKRLFQLTFLYYILPDSLAPIGDTLERDWRDIDSGYISIRNGFATIEQRFGPFTIQHVSSIGDTLGDTSNFFDKEWFVNFRNYVNIDSAVLYLLKMPFLDTITGTNDFYGYPRSFSFVSERPLKAAIHMWPLPCRNELFIRAPEPYNDIVIYDPLGRVVTSYTREASVNILRLDISKLPNGVYYLYISGQVLKVLIQK